MTFNSLRIAGVALICSLPVAGFALTTEEMDVNGDGLLTIDEVQAAYPDLSVDSFTAMDLNADGALDAEELAAAQEAGMIPASDG